MRSIVLTLAFASLVTLGLALQVTEPDENTVWIGTGAQTVSWESVGTDPSNFTIVLVTGGNSNAGQVIKDFQSTSDSSTTVDPPSGGWPTGEAFQVNLVQDETRISSILAQSSQFNISASGSSSTSSGASSSSSGSATTPITRSVSGSTVVVTPTSSDSGTGTAASSTPSNAASVLQVSTGIVGILAIVGAALA